GEHMVDRHPLSHQLLAGGEQGGARYLVATVADRLYEPELDRLARDLLVVRPPEALVELLLRDVLGLLVPERREHGALEAERLLHRAARTLDQALDRLEVEALGLHFLDELDAGEVLFVVIAGAGLDHGWRPAAARLVRTDVAHGHPGALSELIDRQPTPAVRGGGH